MKLVNYVTLYSKLTIKADGESAGLRKLSQRIRMSLARGRAQSEVDANKLLANLAHKPIVHRDELVVFE